MTCARDGDCYWAEVHHWSQVEHILNLRSGLVLWRRLKECNVFCHDFHEVLADKEKNEKGRSVETGIKQVTAIGAF